MNTIVYTITQTIDWEINLEVYHTCGRTMQITSWPLRERLLLTEGYLGASALYRDALGHTKHHTGM